MLIWDPVQDDLKGEGINLPIKLITTAAKCDHGTQTEATAVGLPCGLADVVNFHTF